ncbi:MAG: DUF397 domain-containing protein [Streptomyces sp.]|nr:DUF397 domain-containing protein [Streptomyces sp.]
MRATPDLSTARWRKSSYSNAQEGGECVEVALGTPGLVPVRDSKAPLGPALTFTEAAWHCFLAGVKQGEIPTA